MDPCQPNGNITRSENDPDGSCQCNSNYEGKFCTISKDVGCRDDPCDNDGVCMPNGDSYNCSCQPGYNGTNCELEMCTENYCMNQGTCYVNSEGLRACNCTSDFSGSQCESANTDQCEGVICNHGGKCKPSATSFTCDCVDGYKGTTCDEDPCSAMPCLNNGICTNNGIAPFYSCNCAATEYTGATCATPKQDPCSSNPCKNEASCAIISAQEYKCTCLDGYSGENCTIITPTKTFLFTPSRWGYALSTITTPYSEVTFTMAFAVRSLSSDALERTILSLEIEHTHDVIEVTTGGFKIIEGSKTTSYTNALNGKGWQLVRITFSSQIMTFIVGNTNVATHSYAKAVRGTWKLSFSSLTNPFNGELTSWNVYSSVKNELNLNLTSLSEAFSTLGRGDKFTMLNLYKLVTSLTNIVITSSTNYNNTACPAGYTSTDCTQFKSPDPPAITIKPSTMIKYIGDIEVPIAISELTLPEFKESGVTLSKTCSHTNTTINFNYGENIVNCSATSSSGKTASYQFKVYVAKTSCPSLDSCNTDTQCSYSESSSEDNIKTLSYEVSCLNGASFSNSSVATIYSCDQRFGSWGPQSDNTDEIFKLPQCQVSRKPLAYVMRSSFTFTYTGSTCSVTILRTQYLSFMQTAYGWSLTIATTRLEYGTYTCPTVTGRKKRSNTAGVTMNIPNGDTSASNEFCAALTNQGNPSGCPTLTAQCSYGSVPLNNLCVECSPGSYHNTATNVCDPCAKGSYQPNSGQTSCLQCNGMTTYGVGATSSDSCYSTCPAGQYYNSDTASCQNCASNTVSVSGSLQCSNCPQGQYATPGTSTCSTCGVGNEVTAQGRCEPCSVGSYRDSTSTTCQPCPSGTTTTGSGSTSNAQCTVSVCSAGQYYNSNTRTCTSCPIGSYQPETAQTKCVCCDTGLTTANVGSTNSNQCIVGVADKCLAACHVCDANAVCGSIANSSYTCTCRTPFYTGNGRQCTCASGYTGTNCQTVVTTTTSPPTSSSTDTIVVVWIVLGVVLGLAVIIILIAVLFYVIKLHKATQASRYSPRTLKFSSDGEKNSAYLDTDM